MRISFTTVTSNFQFTAIASSDYLIKIVWVPFVLVWGLLNTDYCA